jgi:DNA-binding NarL/FixJ family response regulator
MSAARGKVLLAEEDHGLRDILRRTLLREGFSVAAVRSGEDSPNAFQGGPFDVFLADLDLAGNGELELLTQLREGVLLPVVLMMGQPTLPTAARALRLGVIDYITKPLDFEELVMLLDGAISRGRAVRALTDAQQRAVIFTESVAALELAIALGGTARPARAKPSAREIQLDPLAYLSAEELERLSRRERQVTRPLALGHAIADIAVSLDLSPNTVRNHVKSIFLKLRVHSQLALLSKLAGHAQ